MPGAATRTGTRRLLVLAALALCELLLIIAVYQLYASIECRLTEVEAACTLLKSMTARGLATIAALALFFWLRRSAYDRLTDLASANPGHPAWLGVHIMGVAVIFLPLVLFGAEGINRSFTPTLLVLLTGGGMAAAGGLLWMTSARNWALWLRGDGYLLPLVLAGAMLVPDLANSLQPLWYVTALTDLTFSLVYHLLRQTSPDVWADPSSHIIGMEGFNVQIGSPCSGVEGIALITAFMLLYTLLLRGEIRQGRYWLVLFPLALLASWSLNVVRISGLILIGARLSATHALNGFHSYAGWLLFTFLAMAILVVAHRWRWLHKSDAPVRSTPLSMDPAAVRILPFVVMMLSIVITQTLWADPETGYPLRAAMMGAALLWVLPGLRQIGFRLDPLAILAGLAVGLAWCLTAPSTDPEAAAPLWILARVFGTVALAPVIEELFFRGYVLDRLGGAGPVRTGLALIVSSLSFALLHDRFIAAALAGFCFGALMLRTRHLGSPIQAHVAANAVVATLATLSSNWALI